MLRNHPRYRGHVCVRACMPCYCSCGSVTIRPPVLCFFLPPSPPPTPPPSPARAGHPSRLPAGQPFQPTQPARLVHLRKRSASRYSRVRKRYRVLPANVARLFGLGGSHRRLLESEREGDMDWCPPSEGPARPSVAAD